MSSMDNVEIIEWQKQTHKRGTLLATWDHMNDREILCLVIDDKKEMVNPFGRKNRLRKITVLLEGNLVKLSQYELFPIGEARQTIPF